MKKLISVFLVIIMFLPLLTGCWNQKELTDLAFVMAMGIDKDKNQKFKLSFQLVNPGNVSSGQMGGGQGLPIAVYRSTGNTLTEAARNATKKISRRLYYAHTNLLVVSEEVAKTNILDIIDALDRDPEFRTTTQMVITKGKTTAEDLVTTLTILDKLPVNKITKQLKSSEAMLGENMSISVDDFILGLLSNGKEPIVNGYKVSGKISKSRTAGNLQKTTTDAFLEADGLAVFKDGKLKGWITNENARGVIWILDKVKSTDINISYKGKKNAISMAPIRSKTKVSASVKNGKPIIDISIEDEGWISEANTAVDLTDPKVILEIQTLVEKETKKQIISSVKAAQKFKSDIFGFGEKIHKSDPMMWKKIQKNWDQQFASLKVNVHVDTYIRREGIRTKPFWSDYHK
jgi:spore germination protein KC